MPNYSAMIQQAQESAKELYGGFGERKTTETREYEPSYGEAQTGLQEGLIGRYEEALGQGPGLGFESTGLEELYALQRAEGIERLQTAGGAKGIRAGGLQQAREALYTGQFDPRAAANLGMQRLNFIGMMQQAMQGAAFEGRGPQLAGTETSTIGAFPGGQGGGTSVSYPGSGGPSASQIAYERNRDRLQAQYGTATNAITDRYYGPGSQSRTL